RAAGASYDLGGSRARLTRNAVVGTRVPARVRGTSLLYAPRSFACSFAMARLRSATSETLSAVSFAVAFGASFPPPRKPREIHRSNFAWTVSLRSLSRPSSGITEALSKETTCPEHTEFLGAAAVEAQTATSYEMHLRRGRRSTGVVSDALSLVRPGDWRTRSA